MATPTVKCTKLTTVKIASATASPSSPNANSDKGSPILAVFGNASDGR